MQVQNFTAHDIRGVFFLTKDTAFRRKSNAVSLYSLPSRLFYVEWVEIRPPVVIIFLFRLF